MWLSMKQFVENVMKVSLCCQWMFVVWYQKLCVRMFLVIDGMNVDSSIIGSFVFSVVKLVVLNDVLVVVYMFSFLFMLIVSVFVVYVMMRLLVSYVKESGV